MFGAVIVAPPPILFAPPIFAPPVVMAPPPVVFGPPMFAPAGFGVGFGFGIP
jgi:hypothetical protein